METVKILQNIFPEWDVGAPCPTIFANEHVVNLAYYSANDNVVIVTFNHCFEYKMGMPDENLVANHPLGKKGLSEYEAHLIEGSEWIAELEKRYSVISNYSRDGRQYQHYIFTFHDRSFECVASGYSFSVKNSNSLIEALKTII